uniref:Myb-like domain-containing protein n=1 Tax=Chenopodium quinoa TaxID=63459 RepID=A0A803N128_CHEQI
MYSNSTSKNSSEPPSARSSKQHQTRKDGEWTKEENKIFENSLAELGIDHNDLFEQIALRIPGKTVEQIKEHFEALVNDIERIESGEFDHMID